MIQKFISIGCIIAVIGMISSVIAETNFSRINGFEPRFLPPASTLYKNVKTDYGARGDGVTDDTKAFTDCIASGARMIYVPAGTYLIKSQLRVRDGVTLFLLIGECRSTTVLKLADNTAGFNNPAAPRAFVHTRAPSQFGEQNFAMYVYHLTIEIGTGNPGAIGLNFHTNNTGQVRDVCVRASDPVNGKGLRGVAFDDWWFGPGSSRYLEVAGFKTGIYVGSAQNHVTLEHVNISNCDVGLNIAYFPDTVMCVSCRDLVTKNCAMAVKNGGSLALIESELGGSGAAAIDNRGSLLCRAVTTSGFTQAIVSSSAAGDLAGPAIPHYSSLPPAFLWDPGSGMDQTLGLPVKESPEYPYPATAAEWTVIGTAGDVGQSVNAAIANGATDIMLTGGRISSTIAVKGAVRRIMGLGVRWLGMAVPNQPVFRIEDGASPAVIVELIYDNYGGNYSVIYEHASKRSLVIRNSGSNTLACYRNTAAAAGGDVFIESVVGPLFNFTGMNAWLRDINTEGTGIGITNDNSKVWILGHKTEAYSTKLKTMNNGFTELLGGTYRQTYDLVQQQNAGINPDNTPLFIIDNAHASLHYRDSDCYGEPQRLTGYEFGQLWYKYSVFETRGTETRKRLRSKELCGALPLFVGYTQLVPLAQRREKRTMRNSPLIRAKEAGVAYDLRGRRVQPVAVGAAHAVVVVRAGDMRITVQLLNR